MRTRKGIAWLARLIWLFTFIYLLLGDYYVRYEMYTFPTGEIDGKDETLYEFATRITHCNVGGQVFFLCLFAHILGCLSKKNDERGQSARISASDNL